MIKVLSDALTFSWSYLEDLIREFSASSLAVSEPKMTFEFSLDDCQSQIAFQSRTHQSRREHYVTSGPLRVWVGFKSWSSGRFRKWLSHQRVVTFKQSILLRRGSLQERRRIRQEASPGRCLKSCPMQWSARTHWGLQAFSNMPWSGLVLILKFEVLQ